ncbi:MAG: S8 family serine peptidase [Melioribacteraceae bacterium]|nr:S8 family serine peptidase [Melioribacteraceae bacterium]
MNLKAITILLLVSITSFYAQNDPLLQYQWNLTKIMAPAAWNITTGSSSIIIAIIDCGVQSNHPDLQNKLVTGYDVFGNDNTTDPYGNYYHGTSCAGVAAAET